MILVKDTKLYEMNVMKCKIDSKLSSIRIGFLRVLMFVLHHFKVETSLRRNQQSFGCNFHRIDAWIMKFLSPKKVYR